MEKPSKSYKIVASALVAVGLMTSGYFIGTGLKKFRTYPRPTVQVKGISERQVKSDFAIWKIRFKASGNLLESVRTEFAKSRKMLQGFLTAGGFSLTEISESAPDTQIKYHTVKGEAGAEHDLTGSFIIRTEHVDRVQEQILALSSLVENGLMLGQSWGGGASEVHYQIRNFHALRPQMLEEATRSARAMAEKFAEHSETTVDSILNADQGSFSIEGTDGPYDGDTSLIKKIRLVNRVTYALKE